MSKRWSKLRKQIEDLFVPGLPLHIQCTEIRTTQENQGSLPESLGVFTVRLRKAVIWNFPRQFVHTDTMYPDGNNWQSYGVHDINRLLRAYLDTPKLDLFQKEFHRDFFGITNVLKAADRRLGLQKLQEYFQDTEQPGVRLILETRASLIDS